MVTEPHNSSADDELVFNTNGTSIDDVFCESEDDSDESVEDDYSDNSWE